MKFLFSIVLSVAFATLAVSDAAFAVNATAVPSCNISVLPASISTNQSGDRRGAVYRQKSHTSRGSVYCVRGE